MLNYQRVIENLSLSLSLLLWRKTPCPSWIGNLICNKSLWLNLSTYIYIYTYKYLNISKLCRPYMGHWTTIVFHWWTPGRPKGVRVRIYEQIPFTWNGRLRSPSFLDYIIYQLIISTIIFISIYIYLYVHVWWLNHQCWLISHLMVVRINFCCLCSAGLGSTFAAAVEPLEPFSCGATAPGSTCENWVGWRKARKPCFILQ